VRLFSTFLLCLGMVFVASGDVLAAFCAKPSEKVALDVRVLQSELMVAALSCGQQEAYNRFVQRHRTELSSSGRALKSYFHRRYGSSGKYKLNRFVTQLANQASERSMQQGRGRYCSFADRSFDELLGSRMHSLADFSGFDALYAQHEVKTCSPVKSATAG